MTSWLKVRQATVGSWFEGLVKDGMSTEYDIDAQVQLYRFFRDYLAPAIGAFLTEAVGEGWIEKLRESNQRHGRKGRPEPISQSDPHTLLGALLNRSAFPSLGERISRETVRLVKSVQHSRKELAHFELVGAITVSLSFDDCAKLLEQVDATDSSIRATRLADQLRSGRMIESATSDDPQLALYRFYLKSISPALDQVLTRALGDQWPTILLEMDRDKIPGTSPQTVSRHDPQAAGRILTERLPHEYRAQLASHVPRGTDAHASYLRSVRNSLAHFNNISDSEAIDYFARTARLMKALDRTAEADQAREIAANFHINILQESEQVPDDGVVNGEADTDVAGAAIPQVLPSNSDASIEELIVPVADRAVEESHYSSNLMDSMATDLYIPSEFYSDRPVKGAADIRERIPAARPKRVNRLQNLSAKKAILVVLVAVTALGLISYIPKLTSMGDGGEQKIAASTKGSAKESSPLVPAGLESRIWRFGYTTDLPRSQTEYIFVPEIGNSATTTLILKRTQLRLLVARDSFTPSAWYSAAGKPAAGIPEIVHFGDDLVWAIPMNATSQFDWISSVEYGWATIFYDGADRLSWNIPPSAVSRLPWQLTYYAPKTSVIVGFGIVDFGTRSATTVVGAGDFPPATCPCDWW